MCARTADVEREQSEDAAGAAEARDGVLEASATGLVAGAVATAVMSAFRMPISRSLPPTAWFWAEYVGGGDPGDYPVQSLVLHLLYGSAGGAAFGVAMRPWTDRPEAERERLCTLLGALYGAALSAFGVRVVLARVLGLDLAADERFVFHVSHIVYGLTLGTWVGSRS